MINASPEPISNWIASFLEDSLVVAGILVALHHPGWFLLLLAGMILAGALGLYFACRSIRRMAGSVARRFDRGAPGALQAR